MQKPTHAALESGLGLVGVTRPSRASQPLATAVEKPDRGAAEVTLRAIFWNGDEARLRAFWRIFAQFAVLLAAVLGARALIASAPGPVYAAVEFAITLAVTAGAARFLDRRRLVDLGLRLDWKWWLDLVVGLVLGGLLMAGIFAIEWAAGWISVRGVSPPSALGPLFLGLPVTLVAAASEELLSRGYQLKNGAEGLHGPRMGTRLAIALSFVASSLFFGLGHVGGPHSGLDSFLVLSAVGVLFGVSYLLTGELGLCIGLHTGWNFFQGGFFGFSVSGNAPRSSFVDIVQAGPELWTGGLYGPEAGLLGLAACTVGSVLVIAWVRLLRGQARLWTEMALAPMSGESSAQRHERDSAK